ncbi:prohead serine protease [Fulvimarina manganoxydans]|uniref:Prohead serine protease n=1 Tax=Fulvimarina manganoxydans TaxID=937218 RepID=A0A1W1Y8S8_9HYPH|nr:HK97 family phage prohead protease [Fulvimarina manganoxydans]SMC32545.1 prohead serine protease [Fulvimarina manganoxydans]
MSKALKRALEKRGGEKFAPTTSRALRAAEVKPDTLDENDGSIEMVVATSTAVVRHYYDWDKDEVVEYDEVLPVANCRLPAESGRTVNLLDSHQWWSCKSIIGIGLTDTFKVEGEQIRARFGLSARESVADIVEGIREGVIANGSCGYTIDEYAVAEVAGRLTVTATRWTLLEMSVVPVPADGASQIMRSAHDIVAAHRAAKPKPNQKRSDMTEDQIKALVAESVRSALAEAAKTETPEDKAAREAIEGTRGKPAGNPLPAPQNQPVAGQPAGRSDAEKATIAGLRTTAKRYGVEDTFDEFEKAGADLAELRGIAMNGMRAKSNSTETSGHNLGSPREMTLADLRWEDSAAFRGSQARA